MRARLFQLLSLLAAPLLGCGGKGSSSAVPDAGVDAAPLALECSPAPDSGCGNAGSWVRGVARFDPAQLAPGAQPVLRVALRHRFALLAGEEQIGGRLHAWASFPVADVASGKVEFAIDMCGDGTAMWSEENDAFNLSLILDENGNNDLDAASTNDEAIAIAKPDPGEPAKLVSAIDVSCHAESPCLAVTLDCTSGVACTTFTPITACNKRTPGCQSDASYCK